MKIAVVNLWSPPYINGMTGGLIYALLHLANNLSRLGVEVLGPIAFCKKGAGKHPAYVYLQDVESLNECDFIIFSTAGQGPKSNKGMTPFIDGLLKKLQVPFAIQVHHERELTDLALAREAFIAHPSFALALPIQEEIDLKMNWPKHLQRYVYLSSPDTLRSFGRFEKRDVIITTCRYTSTKRLLELARQANALRIPIEMHGADVNYFYKREVDRLQGEYLKTFGTFALEELPGILSPARWHFNATSQRRNQVKRIELSTAEAVEYGCVPILHRDCVPDWVTNGMAILVNPSVPIDRKEIVDSEVHATAPFIEAFNAEYSNKTKRLLSIIKGIIS